jgi:hypothetical protein
VRRGFSNIAAMLSALLALAAVHRNYAQNALRVSFIFPTASAPNPFKLAPGDLGHLERGSIDNNRAGKKTVRRKDQAAKGAKCPQKNSQVLSSTYRLDFGTR